MAKENIPKYIEERLNLLRNSSFTYQSLFEVCFNQGQRIFGEYLEHYSIKTISYTSMKEYCYKMASYLKTKLASTNGSYVGLYMENCPNWIAIFWGLLMLGYKPALLNCKMPIEINNKIINTLGIKEVVTNETCKVNLNAQLIVLSDEIENKEVKACEAFVPTKWADEIAINTTATSMNYKICIYTGRDITNLAWNAKDILQVSKQIKKHYKHRLKHLLFLPLYHIFGLSAVLIWFTLFGRTMVFLKDYNPNTILNTIKTCEVTHIFSIPLFWNTIAKEIYKEINSLQPKKRKKVYKALDKSIKLQKAFPTLGAKIARKIFKQIINATLGPSILFLISGGSYLPTSTLNLFNALGYWLTAGYGATETGIDCVELRKNPKYRLSGSLGKPLQSIHYQVVNGSLQLKGESTCSYVIDSNGNKLSMHDNWYDMKDQCLFDKDGYMWITGRTDDVFVSQNGEKINPDVIEQQLHFVFVNNFCVFKYQDKLSLLIQINKNSPLFIIKKIVDEVKQQSQKLLDNNLVTQIFYTYDQISNKNAIKVSRAILNKMVSESKITICPFSQLQASITVQPEKVDEEISSKILKIFASVLNVDESKIDPNQNFFFDLGGTSLDYLRLLNEIQDIMQINIKSDVKLISVNDFVRYITRKAAE